MAFEIKDGILIKCDEKNGDIFLDPFTSYNDRG